MSILAPEMIWVAFAVGSIIGCLIVYLAVKL